MIDLTIAPGTKLVILEAGYMRAKTLADFLYTTATGRIVAFDSYNRTRTFNPDGTERGNRNSFGSRATIRLARQEDLNEFEMESIIDELQRLVNENGVGKSLAHTMRLEDLRAMKAVLDNARVHMKVVKTA